MLAVEVLEVKRSQLTDLGVEFPAELRLTPLPAGDNASLTLDDLKNINSQHIGVGVGDLVVSAQDASGATNLLANPRIRAANKQKAKVMIGDKVPVITTTATSTGFVSESVQYIDVGLTFEIQPIISPDNDVTLIISLEVSNITQQLTSKGGTTVYQIGSRSATTTLRLANGETQVLAGLLSDEERRSVTGIPGLGRLPILGRLFSTHSDDAQKTEIVLSVTPRIVRWGSYPKRSEEGLGLLGSGETTAREIGLGTSN